ncbi:MAG: gamma-glutamylcyclotransferase family protein, partial [Candidatus Thermoplasmatota archaeon]|nr:gamma-glutamylcyclotransferase family protein [Candidatus Thermoplasmatota archaeon]
AQCMCNNVFVYGTLKQGHSRESLMINGRKGLPKFGKIQGGLIDLGEFPGLIQGVDDIIGEVHSFSEIRSVLDRLDRVEGFYAHGAPNNLFERILCNVETTDGVMQAWTYRWTGSEGIRVESGEWSKR